MRDAGDIEQEQEKALNKAMCEFQGKMEAIQKDAEVSTGKYSFTYVTLDALIDATRGPLYESGLAVTQEPDFENGMVSVRTIILHVDGGYSGSRIHMPVSQNTPQAVGSAITYARRYSYAAMLGLCAAEDDDGAAAARKPGKAQGDPPLVADMVRVFKAVGVDRARLEKYQGKPLTDMDSDEFKHMRGVYTDITAAETDEDRESLIMDRFGPSPEQRMEAALEGGDLFTTGEKE